MLLKKPTFPKSLHLLICATLYPPEGRISKTHHPHQALYLLPLSCNVNRCIINEWGKGNNAEENEEISSNTSLTNKRMYLHNFSSSWHQFLHYRLICCGLKKHISKLVNKICTLMDSMFCFLFNNLFSSEYIMGQSGCDASLTYHSHLPPLAHMETRLLTFRASHTSPNLLCILSPPCLTLPNNVLGVPLRPYTLGKSYLKHHF